MEVLEILSAIGSFILIVGCITVLYIYIWNRLIKDKPSKSQIIDSQINEKLTIICNYINKLEEHNNADCNSNIHDI